MNSPQEMNAVTVAIRKPGLLWERLARLWPALHFARASRRLRVIETLQLGEKRQLLVVSFGERELLIGAAANFMAKLAELQPAEREVDAE